MIDAEKRENVIKGLEQFIVDFKPFCGNKADWQRVYDVIALLKAQEQKPQVMTLEEVEHLTYGSPYIIETNLPKEEPRLMYGLFSHLGLQGNFSFAFTDGRGYLFDVDYGKRWRCWTSCPTDEQREATSWTQTNGL